MVPGSQGGPGRTQAYAMQACGAEERHGMHWALRRRVRLTIPARRPGILWSWQRTFSAPGVQNGIPKNAGFSISQFAPQS